MGLSSVLHYLAFLFLPSGRLWVRLCDGWRQRQRFVRPGHRKTNHGANDVAELVTCCSRQVGKGRDRPDGLHQTRLGIRPFLQMAFVVTESLSSKDWESIRASTPTCYCIYYTVAAPLIWREQVQLEDARPLGTFPEGRPSQVGHRRACARIGTIVQGSCALQ